MLRKALLFLAMTAGLVLIVVAGVQNHRDRLRAVETARAARVDLVKDGAPSMGDSDSLSVNDALRGKAAPAFTLADLTGKKVSLADYKGHPLVVNFWATYCEPCKDEMPWLQQFSQKYSAQGFDVVGIDYDSEVGKATVTKVAKDLGVSYPILLSNSTVEDAYLNNIDAMPVSFWVDRNGKVVNVTAGLIGKTYADAKTNLEAQIQQTIAAD